MEDKFRRSKVIQRKENFSEFDYSSFYAKTAAGEPLLFGGGPAFLMTCPRTAAHEETEFLTVLYFPFRVVTPSCAMVGGTRNCRSLVNSGLTFASLRLCVSFNRSFTPGQFLESD